MFAVGTTQIARACYEAWNKRQAPIYGQLYIPWEHLIPPEQQLWKHVAEAAAKILADAMEAAP